MGTPCNARMMRIELSPDAVREVSARGHNPPTSLQGCLKPGLCAMSTLGRIKDALLELMR